MEDREPLRKSPTPGYCLVSKQIMEDNLRVGYMERVEPMEVGEDSGWRFYSGEEDQDYVDNEANIILINIDFVVEKDPTILPYLKFPFPMELEREPGQPDFYRIES